ncbi:MAG: zinc-ribbon domain-containing protein [Labilithrix sp.]|nr:zinc-ribbon domain-containing protein [Labilithrix sp.]
MKIQCQSCQAKYTIADEKVLGKVVKIRCKKCSSTIVINGNEQPHAEEAADTHVFDYANQSNEQWTVNVADGDQRTMTVAEIAAEYRAGVVTDETYCWKDGMADWLPLREVEQIYGSLKLGGGGRMADEVSVPAQSVPPPGAAAPLFAAPAASVGESPFAAPAHSNGNGSGALFGGAAGMEQHAPAAARRAGGRAQGADLFGNVEKAGGEDDVMTSAAAGGLGAAAAGEEKLTGQRNENSVLFSLSALTDKPKETSSNRTTASADGSGLIDIRALSANMDDGEKKKDTGARVDDIMNLSGGGAFGAALAAPILAPPPLEAVDMGVMSASGAPPKQNKTLVFAILGGCAFIAIAIVAAVALTRGPAPDTKTAETPNGPVSAATPDPTSAVAANDTATPPPGNAAPTADNTPPPPGTGQSASKTPTVNPAPKAPSGGGAAVAAAPKTAPDPAPAAPKTPDKPKDLSGALAEAAGKKPEAPSGGGGSSSTAPFDRGAAAAALGAVNVQSCKKSDGPTGSGHVMVTFAPDGSVQSAVIDGGPYPGTTVGGCIAGKYRGARVPAFGGAPVRVGKSFTVN